MTHPAEDAQASTAAALSPEQAGELAHRVLAEVGRAVVGKDEVLELIMVAVLAGGHVLLEDLPGLGKTLMAKSFAAVLGLDFARVQFTPDLLPSDLTGATLYDQKAGEFVFRRGPLFTQVLLADELNRTPPKTQSALLEAMGEHQVSIDGVTHRLPAPFVVLATDNPIEHEGTYPLPEAQLDRFLVRAGLGHLDADGEAEMVRRRLSRRQETVALRAVTDAGQVLGMRAAVEDVEVDRDVLAYAVALVAATRGHSAVRAGASPRGTLGLVQAARAAALLAGRDFALPDDVKRLAPPVLSHRIVVTDEAWVRQVTGAHVVADALASVPVPVPRRVAAGTTVR